MPRSRDRVLLIPGASLLEGEAYVLRVCFIIHSGAHLDLVMDEVSR